MRLFNQRLQGTLLACLLCFPMFVFATDVIVRTPLGDFEIELLVNAAPVTVANFLKYVNDGDYNDSFIHRSVPGFVIQGGGFAWKDNEVVTIPPDPPIVNEYGISNTRGTVAMAKLGSDPNSATSQWFINLADNSANLDTQNGGFTVFGRVKGNGMQIVDAIAALSVWNAGSVFDNLPLINYVSGEAVATRHLVLTNVVADSDGDGMYDDVDSFPADPSESSDNDADGAGDNGDPDDDNDGIPDGIEAEAGLDPLQAADADDDLDGDGFSNLAEYNAGTVISDPASNPDAQRALNAILNIIISDESE